MTMEGLQCGELLKRINDLFQARANRELQELDVTITQMKMMVYLDPQPDHSATLKEMERHFGTAQATIAGIAGRLEKKQLLESYTDALDRRIKHVCLSPSGLALCQHARASMEAKEDWLLRTLTPEERLEFRRLLKKVYDSTL